MLVLIIVCVCWSAAFFGVFVLLVDKGNGYGRWGSSWAVVLLSDGLWSSFHV
jgi:hypothetical protein